MAILILDTETCPIEPCDKVAKQNNLVYNIGWRIVYPSVGKAGESKSYLVKEIFIDEAQKMATCYYADKLPQYHEGMKTHQYTLAGFFDIIADLAETCNRCHVTAICAHNAAFDIDALNTTIRYLTGLHTIRALPQNIEVWDSVKMANSILGTNKKYKQWCMTNNYMTKHKNPRPRMTAEILYKYITGNLDIKEEHTALADVIIETEIVFYLYSKHKKMNCVLYPAC